MRAGRRPQGGWQEGGSGRTGRAELTGRCRRWRAGKTRQGRKAGWDLGREGVSGLDNKVRVGQDIM